MAGLDAFNILRKLSTDTSILARTCMNQNESGAYEREIRKRMWRWNCQRGLLPEPEERYQHNKALDRWKTLASEFADLPLERVKWFFKILISVWFGAQNRSAGWIVLYQNITTCRLTTYINANHLDGEFFQGACEIFFS